MKKKEILPLPIFFNNNIPASPQPRSLSLDHWKPETSDSSRPSRWIPTHWHSNAKVHHPTRSYLVLKVFQWRKSRITQKNLKNTKLIVREGLDVRLTPPKKTPNIIYTNWGQGKTRIRFQFPYCLRKMIQVAVSLSHHTTRYCEDDDLSKNKPTSKTYSVIPWILRQESWLGHYF